MAVLRLDEVRVRLVAAAGQNRSDLRVTDVDVYRPRYIYPPQRFAGSFSWIDIPTCDSSRQL